MKLLKFFTMLVTLVVVARRNAELMTESTFDSHIKNEDWLPYNEIFDANYRYEADAYSSIDEWPINQNVVNYNFLGMFLESAVNEYTATKDFIKNINKEKVTPTLKKEYVDRIESLLKKMRGNPDLSKDILTKVEETYVLEELVKTEKLLTIFQKNGLKGKVAEQLFFGGHFMLEDGGALFEELKDIKDKNGKLVAQERFSSHFSATRVEEWGISCGRIIPEILFIKSIDSEGRVFSHFQVEASPWRMTPSGGLSNFIPSLDSLQTMEHVYDSLIYFAAKQISHFRNQTIWNRSSYGWSPFADNNPIKSLDSLPDFTEIPDTQLTEVVSIILDKGFELLDKQYAGFIRERLFDTEKWLENYEINELAIVLVFSTILYILKKQDRETSLSNVKKELYALSFIIVKQLLTDSTITLVLQTLNDEKVTNSLLRLPLEQQLIGIICSATIAVVILKDKNAQKTLLEGVDMALTNKLVTGLVRQLKNPFLETLSLLGVAYANKNVSKTLLNDGVKKLLEKTPSIDAQPIVRQGMRFFSRVSNPWPVVNSANNESNIDEEPDSEVGARNAL
ncbi:hypothetical protein [Legionella feeleii]|uniref:Substrate of the Dot/Icm secretion system n=1 Tax=Legionella feeleii TaxID=453 RepID=A0A378KKL5_9GAMM|nr:hypothetical protein [Legionella feeleii]STX88378.1 Uncharacterised protein [Legionella feeleii]